MNTLERITHNITSASHLSVDNITCDSDRGSCSAAVSSASSSFLAGWLPERRWIACTDAAAWYQPDKSQLNGTAGTVSASASEWRSNVPARLAQSRPC